MKTSKDIRQLWQQNYKSPTSSDIAKMCLLKAFHAKTNGDRTEIAYNLLRKSFTPVTNPVALANGRSQFDTLKVILNLLAANARGYINAHKEGSVPRWPALAFFNLPYELIFDASEDTLSFLEFLQEFKSLDANKMKRYYSYIFIDNFGVTPEQVMVQAAHVAMVVGKNMGPDFDPHKIFYQIVELPVGVTHEDLERKHKDFVFHKFVEPDLNNKIVASAIEPILYSKRTELKKYPLVTF